MELSEQDELLEMDEWKRKGRLERSTKREGRGESERRRGKNGWRKVLYGEYGAAVRRVFIAAAICRPIVITALSNPSYDCMCHAGSMLRPRHRASLRTRIHHFFAAAKRVDPFLLQRDPCMDANRVYIYILRLARFSWTDRAWITEREKESEPK